MVSKAYAGRYFPRFFPRLLSVSLACFAVAGIAQAQSDSVLGGLAKGLTSGQLMNMQQSMSGSPSAGDSTAQQIMVQPQQMTADQMQEMQQPSELEKLYSKRAGEPLKQFGYNQFGYGKPVVLTQVGGVVNNYILGVGDEIIVSLRGQENNEYQLKVNRAGQVILPRMAPVSAAGRTFGAFRADLDAAIHRAYVSTQASISIGQVRQINVFVSGEVHSPGMRTLTGLSTVVDAILLSGGIRKDGSLRNVEIQRGGRTLNVDLYSVLAGNGPGANLSLEDGDRIVIPSVGNTFAVSGDLHRNGIYELPAHSGVMSLRRALSLAGNTLVPGVYRISLLRQDKSGQTQLVDVSGQENAVVRGGDVVSVKMVTDIAMNQISLRGAVQSPGVFSLQKYKTLHDMLPSADIFTHDAYMLFGYIDRINHISHQHELVPFSPKHIVEGKENITLQGDDRVVVLSLDDEQSTVRDVMLRVQAQEAFNATGDRSLLDQASLSAQKLTEGNTTKVLGYHGDASKMQQGQSLDKTSGNSAAANQLMGRYDSAMSSDANAQMTQNSAQSGMAMPMSGMSAGVPTNGMSANGMSANGMSANGMSAYGPASSTASGVPTNGMMAQSGSSAQSGTLTGTASTQLTDNSQNAFQAGNQNGQNALDQMRMAPMTLDQKLAQMAVYFRASVEGAVQEPGIYLVAPGTTLDEAIAAAGGLRTDADRSSVEITSSKLDSAAGTSTTTRKDYSIADMARAKDIVLRAQDSVVFHKIFTNRAGGTVTILGQVRYPGTYSILRGERLSSVLMRAGGLTASAYPYGTVFLRQSIASLEKAAHKREANQLENMLIVAMSRVSTDSQMKSDSFTALQGYVQQLQYAEALGRMTVSADPAALAANPADDPVMEAGDKVIVPKRPFTVSVMGEVLQQTSVPFKAGMDAEDYIKMAGGFSQMADDDEIFVVLPDGSAYRAGQSWFGLGEKDIPPGSMVYVGRDMSGYDLRQGVIDVTRIFSQLATSLAAIAAIND